MATPRLCTIEDCGKPQRARGYCLRHYERLRRHGDPRAGRVLNGVPLAYYREVVLSFDGDDCLLWPYGRDGSGRGSLWIDGTMQLVHRLACEHVNGPPPSSDYESAHSCGNGHLGCVSPKHVRWATSADNKADSIAHGTAARGERCGTSKLTTEDVRAIRSLIGTASQADLGQKFAVSQTAISRIKIGRSWRS